MLVAVPFCKFGRITSKPIFSYMLRSWGILKSWVSPSLLPLKRLRVVPIGSACQVAHWNTWGSRGGFAGRRVVDRWSGSPDAVCPPPDWLGTVIELGSVSSRLRNGLGGKFTVMMKSV